MEQGPRVQIIQENQIVQMICNYKKDVAQLEDDILGLYLDLFLYNLTLFLINSHIMWDLTLNIPIIILLVIHFLGLYVNSKKTTGTFNKGCDILDSLCICAYLIHLLLYVNDLANNLFISSLIFFIEYLLILLVQVKHFLLEQPFFKFYFLIKIVIWITRLFIHVILTAVSGEKELANSEDFQIVQTLCTVYFYIMITISFFLLLTIFHECFQKEYDQQFIKNRVSGQFLLMLSFTGIGLSTFWVAQTFYEQQQKEKGRLTIRNVYFLSIYHIIEIILLIHFYKPVILFLKTGHLNYEKLINFQPYSRYNFTNLQANNNNGINHQVPVTPQVYIREIETQGIIKVALRRISSTLFKVVKKPIQIPQEQQHEKLETLASNGNDQNPIASNGIDQNPIAPRSSQIKFQYKFQIHPDSLPDSISSHTNKDNEENSSIERAEKCIVCFENESDSVIHPCGHGGLCYECAKQIMIKQQVCSLCRNKIKSILKYDPKQILSKETYQIISLSAIPKNQQNKIGL